MTRPAGRRTGLTLVEALVALALFAVFASATVAGLSVAARLQQRAELDLRRAAAFEPWIIAGASALDALPPCGSGNGTDTDRAGTEGTDTDEAGTDGACVLHDDRCRLASGGVVCDGGPVRRVRIAHRADVAESRDGAAPRPAVWLDAWSWADP